MTERPRGRRALRANQEAVTGPVSAILAVATVVALVAVYAFFVTRLGHQAPDTVDSGAKADFSADGYYVAPTGPEGLPVTTGKLLVTIDGVNTTVPLAFFSGQLGQSPTWDVGVKLCIVGDAAACYKHSGTNVRVTAIANNNIVFTTEFLHAPGPGFSVGSDGGIDVSRNGTVVLGALGAQYACQNNMNVYVRFSIDGGTTWISPLGSQPVTPGGSGQTFNGNIPKGSKIVVEARGVGAPCGLPDIVINSVATPTQALVLVGGDPAPNYAPFSGQAALTSFLVPYVNTQTLTMVLQPNQVIVLFDICCYPNYAVDFQDLVILFTFP